MSLEKNERVTAAQNISVKKTLHPKMIHCGEEPLDPCCLSIWWCNSNMGTNYMYITSLHCTYF